MKAIDLSAKTVAHRLDRQFPAWLPPDLTMLEVDQIANYGVNLNRYPQLDARKLLYTFGDEIVDLVQRSGRSSVKWMTYSQQCRHFLETAINLWAEDVHGAFCDHKRELYENSQ